MDEVIDLYKRDIDLTLIRASLQRTPEERILALEDFGRFLDELRAAKKRADDQHR